MDSTRLHAMALVKLPGMGREVVRCRAHPSVASHLEHTFASLHRIVLAQLEGSGRGALASMNPRSYEDLVGLIQEHPMTDGDAWLKLLIVKNEMLGAGPVLRCCTSLLRPCRTL